MAITSWAQIGHMKDKLIDDDLIKYYTGFSVSNFYVWNDRHINWILYW